MEPRIIKGHRYLCKKTVEICIIQKDGREKKTGKKDYIKGKVYIGDSDFGYPDETWSFASTKDAYGYIFDEHGAPHCWPYNPQYHSWCHDRWTDYFEDLGEA